MRIVEVRGRREPVPDESATFEAYASGLSHYRKGHWAEGERALLESHALLSDTPSRVLLDRIAILREEAPPDWAGIWTFETR